MTTQKPGAIPTRQAHQVQQTGSRSVGAAPKTKFEAVLKAAAKATRGESPVDDAADVAQAKEALGLVIARSLLKNQKPGDIERDKAVEPEDDD